MDSMRLFPGENEMKLEELSKQKEEKAAAVKGKNNFVMLT